jgi:hypothetical protein
MSGQARGGIEPALFVSPGIGAARPWPHSFEGLGQGMEPPTRHAHFPAGLNASYIVGRCADPLMMPNHC